MIESEKEISNLARWLSRIFFVCTGYNKPIKNTELTESSIVTHCNN